MGKQAHAKKPASTVRLAHSQTGSGADRVWGLRRDLSQEVCWTRPWGHIFNVSQLWMTYRHSAKGVYVCVCVCARMDVHTQDLHLYFSWFWKLKISCWLPLVVQAQVFAVAGRCLWQLWLHNNCVNKKKNCGQIDCLQQVKILWWCFVGGLQLKNTLFPCNFFFSSTVFWRSRMLI